MEPSLSVRPATAILYRVLQRHLQRRREPDGDHHCPVPASARCSARAAPSDRAKLRASAGAARHRQSDARGDCSIHRRTGLFDGTPGNSGQNPQPGGGQVIREDDGARRRRVISSVDEQYYIAEEYKFRVEREKRESERKKIEAEGIRDFQQTVSQGISESYLRWRG